MLERSLLSHKGISRIFEPNLLLNKRGVKILKNINLIEVEIITYCNKSEGFAVGISCSLYCTRFFDLN